MLRHQSDDKGVTAVIMAGSLVMLMGFAAVAIDLSRGFNERRQDQTTADTAALAAGVELMVSGDGQAAIDSIKSFADENLGRTIPPSDWSACVDPDALPVPSTMIPSIADGSPCISFGANDAGVPFAKLRVRLPDQTIDTTFGRAIGSESLTTTAAAEIQLEGSSGLSGAFPSGALSGTGTGATICIKTGPSGPASCGDPSTGDFGNFQPYFYKEVAPGGITSLCTSGNQPDPLARSMADGIDHFLGTTPAAPGDRVNGDDCPFGPLFPNAVDSVGGYSSQNITNGLVTGGSFDGSFTGRLTRKTWGSPFEDATIFGHAVDNRPLWSYIDEDVLDDSTPEACDEAATDGPDAVGSDPTDQQDFDDAQEAMSDCLSAGTVPDGLFTSDLYESPRLVLVPLFHETDPLPNNSCCYNIRSFLPVFIDGVWTTLGPGWSCDGGVVEDEDDNFCKHEPGRAGSIQVSAPGQKRLDSASAIVLSCGVLPGVESPAEKCRTVTDDGNTANVFLNLSLTR